MNGIIVPTCPKDFHWTYGLLDSAERFNENVIVVFSSEQERIDFNRSCNHIVVGPKPDRIESWTTYKKLEALARLCDQYDYLATIDTESVFIRPCTTELKSIWDGNCFVANNTTHCGSQFVESCLKDLNTATDTVNYPYDTNLFCWFNEIQVYPTELIMPFLNWLTKGIIHLASFDYLLFSIFMITKRGHKFRILDCSTPCAVIEGLAHLPQHQHLVSQVYWSVWFPGVETVPSKKILFHRPKSSIFPL